jgi:hypothetical protein
MDDMAKYYWSVLKECVAQHGKLSPFHYLFLLLFFCLLLYFWLFDVCILLLCLYFFFFLTFSHIKISPPFGFLFNETNIQNVKIQFFLLYCFKKMLAVDSIMLWIFISCYFYNILPIWLDLMMLFTILRFALFLYPTDLWWDPEFDNLGFVYLAMI